MILDFDKASKLPSGWADELERQAQAAVRAESKKVWWDLYNRVYARWREHGEMDFEWFLDNLAEEAK